MWHKPHLMHDLPATTEGIRPNCKSFPTYREGAKYPVRHDDKRHASHGYAASKKLASTPVAQFIDQGFRYDIAGSFGYRASQKADPVFGDGNTQVM